MLDVNSPLVTNSLGPIVNESLSIFLKSVGKSYSLSPVVKFCVVLAYNKGTSDASLYTSCMPLLIKSLTAVCIPLLEENVLDVNSVF